MILLDTVVLSELRKSRPNKGVLQFLRAQRHDTTFISVLSLGEIEAGIERQRVAQPEFATELEQWLIQLELRFAQSILPVSPVVAKVWGRLCVQTGNKGIDNLIAATALCHQLTVVTRYARHFEPAGVRVIDPFTV